MRKKSLALAFFIIIATCFHACDFNLPKEVEIRVKPELGIPVNGGLSNLILSKIKDATAKHDIDAYQYSDKKIMTFLLKYNILKDHPLEYFDEFQTVLDEFKIDLPLEEQHQEIKFDQLSSINEGAGPVTVEVKLTEVLENAEASLTFNMDDDETNESDEGGNENEHMKIIPIGLGLSADHTGEKYSFKVSLKKFEDVTFANGLLTVHLELIPDPDPDPDTFPDDTNFSFEKTFIQYGPANNPEIIWGHSKENPGDPIRFTKTKNFNYVEYDLAGRTIPQIFWIHIEDIKDETKTFQMAKLIIYESKVEPPEDDPTLPLIKGVTGYAVEDGEFEFEVEEKSIQLGYDSSEFVHAQIGKGSITFNIDLPKSDDDPENKDPTWITLKNNYKNDFIKEIWVHQAAVQDEGHWPGLSNKTTNIAGVESGLDTDPWLYVEPTNGNLNDRHINRNEIVILGIGGEVDPPEISVIRIPEGKISFMLSNEVLKKEEKTFDLTITPVINLEILDFAHIKPGDIFPKMSKEISLDKAASYFNAIHFDKVGVVLTFGQVDIPDLEIMISEQDLGINKDRDYQDIPMKSKGEDPTVEFIRDDGKDFILKLRDSDGDIILHKLNLEVEIRHKSQKAIIEVPNINIKDPSLKMEIDHYEVLFKENWTVAMLDLDSMEFPMKGSFPKEEENDPIDLASMLEMLQGFKVKNIESYLYIDAPKKFLKLEPEVALEAIDYAQGTIYELLEENFVLKETHEIPKLVENADGKISGEIKKGVKVDFQQIMDALPEDLRITYNFGFEDGIPVTPDFLADSEIGETVNVSLIVIVPMDLENGEDGSIFEIPSMFEENKDVFGREKKGEDGPYLGYINSLVLNVKLNDTIFDTGTLYMKRDLGNGEKEEDGKELLRFDLKGKSLSIPIKGDLLDTIRNIYPYSISDMGIRFKPNISIQLPNDLAIEKIEFDADVTYGYKF